MEGHLSVLIWISILSSFSPGLNLARSPNHTPPSQLLRYIKHQDEKKPEKRSAANWETVETLEGELVNISWPVKRVGSLDGDIILGGLMMIHERADKSTCGKIMRQGGIQAMEVMLYTIDYVNRHYNVPGLLPGITLGAYILDDCDKDTYGLEMAVDFIKGRRAGRLKVTRWDTSWLKALWVSLRGVPVTQS